MKRSALYIQSMLFGGMLCLVLHTTAQSNSVDYRQQQQLQNLPQKDTIQFYLDSARVVRPNNALGAIQVYNKVIQIAIRDHDALREAQAYMQIANVRRDLQQYDAAILNYEKCLNVLKSALGRSNDVGLNHKLNLLFFDAGLLEADAYLKLKRYKESETVLKPLYNNASVIADKSRHDRLVRKGAEIQAAMGNSSAAMDALTSLLTDEQNSNRNADRIETLLLIGEIANTTGAIKKSEEYFKLAKALSENSGNQELQIRSNNALSSFYRSHDNYLQEINSRNNNVQLNQLFNNNDAVQFENLEIGNAYLNDNNLPKAEEYIQNSVQQLVRSSIDLHVASMDTIMSAPLPVRSEKLQMGADAYRRLAEGFLKQNALQKAVEYFKEYSKMQDSADAERKREMAIALELSAGFGRDQQRIELLEQERALSEKSMQVLQQDRDIKSEQVFNRNLIIGLLIGCVLSLIAAGIIMVRNIRARRKADKLLALQSLNGQMNPHFIFNALNSVNEYISQNDERAANRYLSSFSKLMRQVMDDSRHTFISLHEEIEMLKLYLELEQSRFKDQFTYELHISDDLLKSEFEIPPMLIQPYLENAIWHGLRYRSTPGRLIIHMSNIADQLIIEICDNGIGIQQSKKLKTQHQKKQSSLAMQNIRTRVDLLNDIFKTTIQILITSENDDQEYPGTKVRIQIPQMSLQD